MYCDLQVAAALTGWRSDDPASVEADDKMADSLTPACLARGHLNPSIRTMAPYGHSRKASLA